MGREAWLAAPRLDAALAQRAAELGIAALLLPEGSKASTGALPLVTQEDSGQLRRDGKPFGTRVEIRTPADQDRARARVGVDDVLLIAARDWKIIPLENLIAACQPTRTKLFAEVRSAEEARTFLATLEVGVHGIVLRSDSVDEMRKLRDVLHAQSEAVPLQRAEVVEVRPAGTGDRVCIDTASLLQPGEGILVGSQSGGLFLIHAENVEAGYVAARPFRVNAGPVHAYALCPGGKTRYLSELAAGDEVLVVRADGAARVAIVGRIKIETRPLVLVRARLGEKVLATLVQNAETVRLVTPKGPRSVTELQTGDQILVRSEDTGRHFGMAVRETIVER
jgi:3-dehydroquinate synthase II